MKITKFISWYLPKLLVVGMRILNHVDYAWEESEKGYVNQGDDTRLAGRIGAFFQHLLSFRPKSFKAIPYATIYKDEEIFVGNPPYLAINIKLETNEYLHIRAGWRYDVNWTNTGGYIASIAMKIIDRPLIYK